MASAPSLTRRVSGWYIQSLLSPNWLNDSVMSYTVEETSYRGALGRRHLAAITALTRGTHGPFTAADAAKVLSLPMIRANRLLAYLASRGWLTRVAFGLYAVPPLEADDPGRWREDPWVLANKRYSPCYIGGWSACEHWDLTEQIFKTGGRVGIRKKPGGHLIIFMRHAANDLGEIRGKIRLGNGAVEHVGAGLAGLEDRRHKIRVAGAAKKENQRCKSLRGKGEHFGRQRPFRGRNTPPWRRITEPDIPGKRPNLGSASPDLPVPAGAPATPRARQYQERETSAKTQSPDLRASTVTSTSGKQSPSDVVQACKFSGTSPCSRSAQWSSECMRATTED